MWKTVLSPREIGLLKVPLSPVEGLVPGKATAGTELEEPCMWTFSGDMISYHIMLNCLCSPQTHKLLKTKDHPCSCAPIVPNEMLGLHRSSKHICGMNERGNE